MERPPRFEVWKLGSSRDDDVYLAGFDNLPDAVGEVHRRLALGKDEYEIRELGQPVESPDYQPASVRRRGTAPGRRQRGG